MDDDFDILSLAIESVENEIDQETDKGASLIKSPLNFHHSKDVTIFQPEPEKCNSSTKSPSSKRNRSLVGINLFSEEVDLPLEDKCVEKKLPEKSLVHGGDTDSSDDEDNKYFEEKRYDSFGKFIKNKLKSTESSSGNNHQESLWKKNTSHGVTSFAPAKAVLKENKIDVNADPIFGIRIVNPLISSQTIKEKMIGRIPIVFSKIKSHVTHGDLKNDWVIAAVLVKKLPPRVSQNGNNYSSWILSDLKSELKTVFLFLFGRAHHELWKTSPGTVFAILNPSVLNDNKASSEHEAKLSIKSPDQVMVWGRSKDLGHCKVLKKNGEMCNAFVNSNLCEVCIYHVKQEYSKCSSRAAFSSSGNLNLRNKVLGKNEVFYAGKSFTSVTPSGKNKKTSSKDVSRLTGLGKTIVNTPEVVSIPYLQRSNEILKLLPSVNNPLNKKTSDKSILDLLSSKKNTDKCSLTNDTSDLKSKHLGIKVPTLTSPCSVDKSILKSTIPGIKLPTLSNPESELLVGLKCNTNSNQTPNNGASVKPPASNRKKNKADLQQRFNSLVYMQSEIKEEKGNVSIHQNVLLTKCEKPVKNQLQKSSPTTLKSSDANNLPSNFKITEEKKIFSSEMKEEKSNVSIHQSTPLTNCERPVKNQLQKSPSETPKTLKSSNVSSLPLAFKIKEEDKNVSNFKGSKTSSTINNENLENCNQSPKTTFSCEIDVSNSPTVNPTRKHAMTGANTPPNSMMSKAKMKALLYVKAKGPISKDNPTKTKIDGRTTSVKRPCPEEGEEENKKSVLSERFIQLMNQKSLHEDLIELREHEQELDYFEKMEKKDRLEEKMLNTYKIDCKAVKCLKCNYLWFSASEACKSERHPLKVIDAVKRFFKCSQCQNRTVSLTIIPLLPCKKCSSTSWVRTAMIKEKLAKNDSLSIRGGEQKFVNSVITNAGLNLLMPDE